MKTIAIVFLVAILKVASAINCTSSSICTCYHSPDDFEFQCPPDDFLVLMHVNPEKGKAKIDCNKDLPLEQLEFPHINLQDFKEFVWIDCSLPRNFSQVLQTKFNSSHIQHLGIESALNIHNVNITKDFFTSLPNLKILEIESSKLKFERDFLGELSGLQILSLNELKLHDINFEFPANLTQLDFTKNLIEVIPSFNLSKLKKLTFWSNKIKVLSSSSFVSLQNLTHLELGVNLIEKIEENSFNFLSSLANLSLFKNNLYKLPEGLFSSNFNLENVRLANNRLESIPEELFNNFAKLKTIHLQINRLKQIKNNFVNLTSLVELNLSNNLLENLQDTLFDSLTKLEMLKLNNNKLTSLPEGIFLNLNSLLSLDLSNNGLTVIAGKLLSRLTNLLTFNLKNNEIKTIGFSSLINLTKLKHLDLSFNEFNVDYLDVTSDVTPFSNLVAIKKINLSHNKINSMLYLNFQAYLESCDLSYNFIEDLDVLYLLSYSAKPLEINLNNNNISSINFSNLNNFLDLDSSKTTKVLINDNPIKCDCTNYELSLYFHGEYPGLVKNLYIEPREGLKCNEGPFKGLDLFDLPYKAFTCNFNELSTNYSCPENCNCFYRNYDTSLVIDCSNLNLTKPPTIFEPPNFAVNQTVVDLSNNSIEELSNTLDSYKNVTSLKLNNNLLKKIDFLPPKNLKSLNLQGNRLKRLSRNFLESIENATRLQEVFLDQNPWSCDCKAKNFQSFLQNSLKVFNSTSIFCENSNKTLFYLQELCSSNKVLYITLVCLFFLFLTIFAILYALYYRYEMPIKVFLYAHNCCLGLITEDELDKDKTYDVFISYSHQDEDFVAQNLLPVLESGSKPYKVCIHQRNFIPGEFIATQIVQSISDSKRTLVVLSESFIKSEWGRMEFRTAHTQAISDGRARVILLILGDIPEDQLDEELNSYLKTNTYVKWGDQYFWNKLRYALPHWKPEKKTGQKLTNMMLKIDDKFGNGLANTTPPASLAKIPQIEFVAE